MEELMRPRVELAEACADIQFQAKVIRAYGDLRGQVLADMCVDVLRSGFARPGTTVALSKSTGEQSVSHVVNVATGALMVFCAVCLYTGTGPGNLTISFGMLPREVIRKILYYKVELMTHVCCRSTTTAD